MPPASVSGRLMDMAWVSGGLDISSVGSSVRPMSPERREDALLAALIGLAGLVEVALGAVPGHTLVASLCLLVMTMALMVRRGHPRLCLVLVLLALVGQSFLGVPVNAQLVTILFILVAAYSVGAHLDRRASAIGLAIGATLASVAIAAANSGGSDYGFGLLLVTGPWIAGVLVRARSAAEAEAVASAQSRARQAANDERERIARELHDIVSHGLSAMVVQAAAAAELIDRSPDAARKAMQEVQTTGAGAMMEMRHMLGLMRGCEAAGRRPQPALSIFRIVQESLTNVRKHATGSRCEVTITHTPEALKVEIVDDGVGGALGPESRGLGIIGMCERARLYGGALEAGPRSPDGGWVVRGWFPLEHHVVES